MQLTTRLSRHLGALWIAMLAVLAGCGGGAAFPDMSIAAQSAEPRAPSSLRTGLMQPDRRSALASPRTDAPKLGATALFDWAERNYKEYLPSARPDLKADPYVYRYYPETGTYLGVADGAVYVLGPVSGGALLRVGDVESFHCLVIPADCAPVLSLVSLSDPAPQALDMVMVKLANLSTQAVTATIRINGVSYPLAVTRSGPANAVGIVPPIWFPDPTKTQTHGYTGTVTLSQGGVSVSFDLSVADLPTLAEFGAETGQITRAVIIATMQSHGRTMNLLQSLRACTGCAGMTATLRSRIDTAIAARGSVVANLAGLGRAVRGLALGQSVSGFLSAGGKDMPLTLNRDAVELSDRILGSLMANVLSKSGALSTRRGILAASATDPRRRAQAIDFKGFFQDTLAPILTGTRSGSKLMVNGANVVNGQEDFWDTVVSGMKTLGPVLVVAELGLAAVGTGAAVGTAAAAAGALAPAVGLGAVVLGTAVGIYSLGNALANAYDYVTADNAVQRNLAYDNMLNSFADTVAGLVNLANGPAKAAEAIGAKITYDAGSAGLQAGQIFDTVNSLAKYVDWLKGDADLANALPPASTTGSPALIEVSMSTKLGVLADGIPPVTTVESTVEGQKVTTSTVVPSNGPGTTAVPPNFGKKAPTTWRANDAVTGTLMALIQTLAGIGTSPGGGTVTLQRGCDFAGSYSGNFTGPDSGTGFITITAGGAVSGSAQSILVGPMSVTGSVSPAGQYDSKVGGSTSTGASFGGVLQSSAVGWQIVGNWLGASGWSGTFQLTRNCGAP